MHKILFTVLIIIIAAAINLAAVLKKPSYKNLLVTNISESISDYDFVKLLDEYVIVKHTVKKGEDISRIAEKYGTDASTIRGINNLKSVVLSPAQEILVINKKGHIHSVSRGDTVENISRKYGINAKTILIANDLEYETDILDEKVLFIPGAKIHFADFLWPVKNYRIAGSFGLRKHPIFKKRIFHEGLDLAKQYGAAVSSASDGRVIFAGYKIGYGKVVIIYHKNGFSTLYGHLKSYCVKAGEYVKAEQSIGAIGSSGYSTGPHLHFEVRKYSRPVNPIKYLGK